jgi:hypothetical protein
MSGRAQLYKTIIVQPFCISRCVELSRQLYTVGMRRVERLFYTTVHTLMTGH